MNPYPPSPLNHAAGQMADKIAPLVLEIDELEYLVHLIGKTLFGDDHDRFVAALELAGIVPVGLSRFQGTDKAVFDLACAGE